MAGERTKHLSNTEQRLALLQSHARVPLVEIRHVPRLLQFMGQLYFDMEMVYLHVLASSPFTPTNH